VIVNSNPGVLEGDSTETTLDTEWSGAIAPSATIKVIVAASTKTADGIDLSALYAVNNNVAPVVSLSYCSCESAMGTAELSFYNFLWQQAAAQGMSVMVAAGDSRAAGCSSARQVRARVEQSTDFAVRRTQRASAVRSSPEEAIPASIGCQQTTLFMAQQSATYQKRFGMEVVPMAVPICGPAAVVRISRMPNRAGKWDRACRRMGGAMFPMFL
jgi:hypothetical protein